MNRIWYHVVGVIGFYITLWIRTAPEDIKRAKANSDCKPFPGSVKPRVSIIVPARNEEHNIRRCITSLLEQDYENYEVKVVDDDSTDGTPHILDNIA